MSIENLRSLRAWSPYLRVELVLPSAAALALLLLVLVTTEFGRSVGVDSSALLRDPAAHFGLPFYAGALSYVSMSFLLIAAAITGFVLVAERPGSVVLAAVTMLSSVMFLDDLLMLHEHVVVVYLGMPAFILPALYGLSVLAIGLALMREADRRKNLGILVPVGLMAVSILGDMANDHLNIGFPTRVEDGTKMAGFGAWATFWAVYSARALR